MGRVAIEKDRKEFRLATLKYDLRIHKYVQELGCGRWDKKSRQWQLPITRLRALREFLSANEYEIDEKSNSAEKFAYTVVPSRTCYIHPSDQEQVVYLDPEKSSWIRVVNVKPPLGLEIQEFEHFFSMKPVNKCLARANGSLVERSFYMAAYIFGREDEDREQKIPDLIEKLWSSCRTQNSSLNHASVFWLDEKGCLAKTSPGFNSSKLVQPDTPLFHLSFGPAMRNLMIEPKVKSGEYTQFLVASEHNTMIVCEGKFQKTHVCSMPKTFNANSAARRLSVVFKCLKR
jgi:hypothetical protein